MKTFSALFLLLALPLLTFGQSTFADCSDITIEAAPQQQAFYGESSDDLTDYFAERLQPIVDNQSPTGRMVLTVVVGEDGAPCLREFNINGEFAIEPNHIKSIVENMGSWTPALKDGTPVGSQFKIAVRFTADGGVVARQVARGGRS
jgi:hypothetical protein